MKTIAFVVPYFGPFPFWMNYFFAGCEKNPSIDFLIYSDNEKPENLPSNVYFRKMSFSQYKALVSDRLGINFTPDNPYKLCDIKPAYGFIHGADLESYEFWGFCDIDLVFGQIRDFVTDEILRNNDFFSAYDRRVSGHFFVCRNTDSCNRAFMKGDSWRRVFEDKNNHCWDEKEFSDLFVKFKNHPPWSRKLLTWFFRPLSRKAHFEEQYSTPGLRYVWVDGSRNFPQYWCWNNGVLTAEGSEREFLYFHFLKWKRGWSSAVGISPCSKSWTISEDGFENLPGGEDV